MALLTPTYITAQEVIDNTSIKELKNSSTSQINGLIVKAQIAIDNYIWDPWEKEDSEQFFKFPLENSDGVPQNVQMATLYITENVFWNMQKQFGTELKSESWDWYSKSFKEGKVTLTDIISGEAKNLLKSYGVNQDNSNLSAYKFNY